MAMVFFLIALLASTIGAISGIGGGVIIKPVLDALGTLDASTISFMSGCTVLTMAVSSFIRGRKNNVPMDFRISIWLAFGASIGGVIGKSIFSMIQTNVNMIQSVCLLLINIGVFVYIKNKSRITTKNCKRPVICLVIGLLLGLVSAFLGIGGGPINIAVLYYFFSMSPKVTAKNSLFIILFSQTTSLVTTITSNTIPVFDVLSLSVMCLGGVLGAIIGAYFCKKMSDEKVEKFFSIVLIALIALNIYNIAIALM